MSKALPKVDQKTIVKDLFRKELKLYPGKKFNYADIGRTYTVPSRTVQYWYDEVLLEQESSFLATQATLHQRAPGAWAAAAGAPWGLAAPMQAAGAAASRAAIILAFNPHSAAQLPAAGAVAAFVAGLSSQVSFARLTSVCARPNLSTPGSTCDAFRAAERSRNRFRLRPLVNTYPLSPRFAGRPPGAPAISSNFSSSSGALHSC
jgi:hypothetical protein